MPAVNLRTPGMDDRGDGKVFCGLELLRFLCAAAIVVLHYKHFLFGVPGAEADVLPLYRLLAFFYSYGNYAVEVFWLLSGFIFFWKYAESIRAGTTSGLKFFILRFSRLYPLHALTLLAVAGLQALFIAKNGAPFVYRNHDLYHFVLHLFFASDWGLDPGILNGKPNWDAGLSFNGPVWSISVEVLAYAAFFFLARRYRFGVKTFAAVIVSLFVLKAALPWIKDVILCQLYFFIGGIIHAVVTRGGAVRPPLRLVAGVGGVAAALLTANIVTDGKVHTPTLIAVSVGLVVVFLALGAAVRSDAVKTVFSRLGDLTYSSYLLHFPVQIAVKLAADRAGIDASVYSHPLTLFGFVAFVFALSYASFTLFERPAQNWLRSRLSPLGRRYAAGTVGG